MGKWTSTFACRFFFRFNLQNTKTENRTSDQPEIFMDEPVLQYKFACNRIFLKDPSNGTKLTQQLSTVKTRLWKTQFCNTFAADRNFYYIKKLDFGILSQKYFLFLKKWYFPPLFPAIISNNFIVNPSIYWNMVSTFICPNRVFTVAA